MVDVNDIVKEMSGKTTEAQINHLTEVLDKRLGGIEQLLAEIFKLMKGRKPGGGM